MEHFDFRRWRDDILKPDWYLKIVPELTVLDHLWRTDKTSYEKTKERVYDFFEEALLNGRVNLGRTGEDWDNERQPIDTVVLHHTSNPPGLRKSRLSAIELVRLYAKYYAKPEYEEDRHIVGQPIYSGHFRNGEQVFWPYHWLVHRYGSCEQLLWNNETGWQSGSWNVNCRSVAICFDGDFENSEPSELELATAAYIVSKYYGHLNIRRIVGHCEVKENRTCPSTLFLRNGHGEGWKAKLLAMI